MNTIQQALIQSLVKLLTPTSPAYGNTLAFERPQTCEQLKQKLQAGDVIFSRTNSFLYEISRRFMGMKYDHVAVIINSKEVIHISPPIISKIDMNFIMDPSRQPLIIRPKLQDRQKFLNVLHNFLGERYNLASIPKFAANQIRRRLNITALNSYSFANLKYSRVCTDTILYCLCRGSQKIKVLTDECANKGKFKQIGCFLPDQVAQILLASDSQIIVKSSFSKEYKFIDIVSKSEENMVNFMSKLKRSIVQKLKRQHKSEKQKENCQDSIGYKQKLIAFQVLSIGLVLAQVLGASINSKLQYFMIILNSIMMIGHIGQIKRIVDGTFMASKL